MDNRSGKTCLFPKNYLITSPYSPKYGKGASSNMFSDAQQYTLFHKRVVYKKGVLDWPKP